MMQFFFLEIIPGYNEDRVRQYDIRHEEMMHRLIEETYGELGNRIIKLPVMPIERRVEIVLANM